MSGDKSMDAFKKYGLKKAEDKLLTHLNFMKWFEELHSPDFNEEALLTLLRHYSDGELYKILAESTKDVAKGLQNALIKRCPNLPVWIKYMDDYNEKNGGQKTDAIEALLDSYNEKAVVIMLQEAKKVEGAEKLATKLQKELTEYWLKEKNYSLLDVFRVMQHGRELEDVLTSPYLLVWTRYLDEYNTANPGHEMDEIRV
ncbi:unnamed protein product [Peronospora destructor]|nr:unnamed protein product [Peronospora destructor]